MLVQIEKIAVIGSGIMGSSIAGHLANMGFPVHLLDLPVGSHGERQRNQLADNAVKSLLKQKPAPLTHQKNISLIEIGNLEDDLHRLREADWIIEVVVETLQVKQELFEKIDCYRKKGSIVSSNTSGISIEAMATGRTADFKRHFLGTHFFNPPRYLKLLELIPTQNTDPAILSFMSSFAENRLGKGTVIAKDTPNFIANRIGTYGLLVTVREMAKAGLSIGEVDSITGTLIGRPKSATFRTLDLVGLDTFIHVANNVFEQVDGEEKTVFAIPEFMKKMAEQKWLGEKTKQGFYRKQGKEILELQPETMTYGPRKKLRTPAIEAAKQLKGAQKRIKSLMYAGDPAGTFLWNISAPVLLLCAEKLGEIADTIPAIDQAMKWGFGWQYGPFEMWDMMGLESSVERMQKEGRMVPKWIKDMLAEGNDTFYKRSAGKQYYYSAGQYVEEKQHSRQLYLTFLKDQDKVIKRNSGASLLDIGDDVALLEFHSQNNAIGFDIIHMINQSIDEVEKNYKGLVIGNQGRNFCVGANLAMILLAAQDDDADEIELVVRQFQQAMMKIKYSKRPVVAAPFSMTLGGGAEVCLPSARVQASMETYIGLVETGVGLIPGGGGNKELYMKILANMPSGVKIDLQEVANQVFETIALAKVSTSAEEAKDTNFISHLDGISMNSDHLLYDAKQVVLQLTEKGYGPPLREKVPVTGETGYATLLLAAENMHQSGYISDHDLKIAKKLAFVIAGGRVPYGAAVDEQYLLDIEREAFLSLVTEPKTQQRMQHMLLKGKPLRN